MNSVLYLELITILILIWITLGRFNPGIFLLASIAAIGAAVSVSLINIILTQSSKSIV